MWLFPLDHRGLMEKGELCRELPKYLSEIGLAAPLLSMSTLPATLWQL